jgi:hypothetical protein
MLEGMLDVQRQEVTRLLSDIDEAEAEARLVPSLTTQLGLVKHATFVEKVWFHSRVAGVPRSGGRTARHGRRELRARARGHDESISTTYAVVYFT